MIFNPVVASGGAGGSAWKEVDWGYLAEHCQDHNANFLVAVFTTDFPNQPMIIPASNIFSIGNANSGQLSVCSYYLRHENEPTLYYVYTVGEGINISTDEAGYDSVVILRFYGPGEPDIIPEGWSIKYYIYEG